MSSRPSNMLMANRLVYGMSNERIIPLGLGTVHPARRTPWVSILFTSAIAVVLVSVVPLDELRGTTSLLLHVREYLIVAGLLVVGVALYVVNRLFVGKVEFDPAKLYRE